MGVRARHPAMSGARRRQRLAAQRAYAQAQHNAGGQRNHDQEGGQALASEQGCARCQVGGAIGQAGRGASQGGQER